ncbi:MAG: RNA polymerase factor sigma-32 [Proteobacteria bacterium]|nr:RNA polymerase factor sigma-32 [Pseudomonadota bacterium]
MKRRPKGQPDISNSKISVPSVVTDKHIPRVRDSLRAYITEISKYPVLSKEEEEKVVKRMLEGDVKAAKILVMANLRLVVKIAFEYRNTYQNIMDLIQEGNIGLMKAISMYDPNRGAKISYYSSWWIRSYILKFLIDNFRLVKIGTTQAQKRLFYNLMQEQRRLENQGRLALPETLSKELDVSEKDILEMTTRLMGNSEVSFDQPIDEYGEDGKTFESVYQDNSMRPDELVEEKEQAIRLREKLKEIAKTLNDKEKVILRDRLLSDTPFTLQEIADRFGISKERTRQLEERIIKRMKEELSEFES